mgnify:FL=1
MVNLKDRFSEAKILRAIGYVVLAFLIFAAILLTAYTVYTFVDKLSSGILSDVNQMIANALTIIVVLELYESLKAFLTGKGRSLTYVVDASIVLVVREIILQLFQKSTSELPYLVLTVGVLAGVRYVLSR